MISNKNITDESLYKEQDYIITVGKLKEFIEKNNISDDTFILSQRVEDNYFINKEWNNQKIEPWGTYKYKDITTYKDQIFIDEYISVRCIHLDKNKILLNLHG